MAEPAALVAAAGVMLTGVASPRNSERVEYRQFNAVPTGPSHPRGAARNGADRGGGPCAGLYRDGQLFQTLVIVGFAGGGAALGRARCLHSDRAAFVRRTRAEVELLVCALVGRAGGGGSWGSVMRALVARLNMRDPVTCSGTATTASAGVAGRRPAARLAEALIDRSRRRR